MQTAEIEILDRGEKRDVRGRVIQRRQERERLLAAYDQSGLTQRSFAEREGIKFSTLTWWLKQRRERERTDKPVRFEQYQIGESAGVAAVEIELPDGTRVRGGDVAAVVEVIKVLRACGRC